MQASLYKGDDGKEFDVAEIPADMRDVAAEYHRKLGEAVVEQDDHLIEKFLDEQPITTDEIRAALRKGTCAGQIVPVTCGSAYKNKGVQPLLDSVIDFLPSPIDVGAVHGLDPYSHEP